MNFRGLVMNEKRIVFFTLGSLGDIYPFLALSRELKRRGHSPVIATMPIYRKEVESKGVAFRPVRPDVNLSDKSMLRRAMDRRNGGNYIITQILLPALRQSYEDTAIAASDADLIVVHPMALAAFLYAQKAPIPWASVALAPVSMYSVHDPSILSGLPFAELLASFGPGFQKQLLRTLGFLLEAQWRPFRRLERDLGLSPSPNPLLRGHSPHLALGLFSQVLAAPQPDWPSTAHLTGFPFYRHDREMPVELQQFLDSGGPPIVFTLGSAAVGVAGDFFRQSVEAACRLGRRAVLLTGSDPANQPKKRLPPGIIAIPYAPHAAVFSRASVIVHQGGIGTTAEAMRAGRPMMVVPFSHDQPDQAARLARLGVARTIRRENYTSMTAAREIDLLLQGSLYAVRAAEVAYRVRKENGAVAACDLLCGLLRKTNSGGIPKERAACQAA
jgi:UDP:flavonoid glycosyltransferase YjiC (YdhE family)